ncbi:MAG: DegV family protein [Dorea sp.]
MGYKFNIVSDGSCDLPEQMTEENQIRVVHFLVSFDGETYRKEGIEIKLDDFYQQMVDHPKTFPMTAAPSPEDFYQVFQDSARKGQDILCICISGKLSSSIQSAQIARQMLVEDYPDIHVEILDSLACTLMQGAFVLEACRLRNAGYDLKDAVEIMTALIPTGRILFTVGDLEYLQHGGRIGKVTSIAGSLLNVKPLITLENGEIHSSGIKRGRKNSLNGTIQLLTDYLKKTHMTPDDCTILIGYGYDAKEAASFQKLTLGKLQEIYPDVPDIPVFHIGATIGVHAGPYSIGFGVVRRSDRI